MTPTRPIIGGKKRKAQSPATPAHHHCCQTVHQPKNTRLGIPSNNSQVRGCAPVGKMKRESLLEMILATTCRSSQTPSCGEGFDQVCLGAILVKLAGKLQGSELCRVLQILVRSSPK
mmetsp:Transcript_4476/g.6886  ORF Transcript_4476/g.6886 Transcript_4476/m.6886 type:complete len:117 (+) Transcript_4476:182-532(+)